MGIENATCNNCGGKLQVSRYIEGTRAVVKTSCQKCKIEGVSASAVPSQDLPEWFMTTRQNGKRPGRLA
jgi:hypothetical protein